MTIEARKWDYLLSFLFDFAHSFSFSAFPRCRMLQENIYLTQERFGTVFTNYYENITGPYDQVTHPFFFRWNFSSFLSVGNVARRSDRRTRHTRSGLKRRVFRTFLSFIFGLIQKTADSLKVLLIDIPDIADYSLWVLTLSFSLSLPLLFESLFSILSLIFLIFSSQIGVPFFSLLFLGGIIPIIPSILF